MRILGLIALSVIAFAVACTSETTPTPAATPTPTTVPTVTSTPPPPSAAELLQEARQKIQETSTLLVRMTYPTAPDQDTEEYERVLVEFTRDKYHIIGESYEGESYYYPSGGWSCIGEVFYAGENAVIAWQPVGTPKEEPTNLIASRFAPMLEAPYPLLGQFQWILEDWRRYYYLYNVLVPGSVLEGNESSQVGASLWIDVETRSVGRWRSLVLRGSKRGVHTFDFLEFDYGLSIEMPCEP